MVGTGVEVESRSKIFIELTRENPHLTYVISHRSFVVAIPVVVSVAVFSDPVLYDIVLRCLGVMLQVMSLVFSDVGYNLLILPVIGNLTVFDPFLKR